MNHGFLRRVAQCIWQQDTPLQHQEVVLPTRRAAGALRSILTESAGAATWLPRFTTIDEWACEIAGLTQADPLELRFMCYEAYRKHLGGNAARIGAFFTWVDVLLGDFNDLEQYLIAPGELFRELNAYKELEHFSFLTDGPLSERQESYRRFWSALPAIHRELNERLLRAGIGYPGLISRQAASRWAAYRQMNPAVYYTIAGLNALSAAEAKLLRQVQESHAGRIYFDADPTWLAQPANHAGLFIRRYVGEGLGEVLAPEPTLHERPVQVVLTDAVNRIQLCDALAAHLSPLSPDELRRTAVVLTDESLLTPVLNRLPPHITQVNVTMGLSAAEGAFYHWLESLFNLQEAAGEGPFAERLLTEWLTQPLWKHLSLWETETLPTRDTIARPGTPGESWWDEVCFPPRIAECLVPWQDAPAALDGIAMLCDILGGCLEEARGHRHELYHCAKGLAALSTAVQKLRTYPEASALELRNLASILLRAVRSASLAITGDPYDGLQVMGLLESRTLGFDRVYLLPANEGKLPGTQRTESFIPFEIRQYHHMPGKREREAVYAYLFYRLLSHSDHFCALYLSDTDDPEGGERSRYVLQLQYELTEVYGKPAPVSARLSQKVSASSCTPKIEKNESVLELISTYVGTRLSASGINKFLADPLDWFYSNVLSLQEPEDEPGITHALYGTLLHSTLEQLYTPYLNAVIRPAHIDAMLGGLPRLLARAFAEHQASREHRYGINHIHYERAKHMLRAYLVSEKQRLEAGDVVVVSHLEKKLQAQLSISLPEGGSLTANVKGYADRLEKRNGVLHIVDFKTGNVRMDDLKLPDQTTESYRKKPKAVQLHLYEWLAKQEGIAGAAGACAQIISLVTPAQRQLVPAISLATPEHTRAFEAFLADVVCAMLNSEPLRRPADSKYAKFETWGATTSDEN